MPDGLRELLSVSRGHLSECPDSSPTPLRLADLLGECTCASADIQGTGATVLAGVLGALRMTGQPPEAIANLKVAVVGAGSAGIGVSQALQSAMVEAGAAGGLAGAAKNFMVFDKDGLVGHSRPIGGPITEEVMAFARSDLPDGMHDQLPWRSNLFSCSPSLVLAKPGCSRVPLLCSGMSLEEAVDKEKPQLILGLSGDRRAGIDLPCECRHWRCTDLLALSL